MSDEEVFLDHIDEEDESFCCPHCGKPLDDFSDLGCKYCDARCEDWGIW